MSRRLACILCLCQGTSNSRTLVPVGGWLFKGGSLPKPAQEVVDIFVRAYQLAKNEQGNSTERIEKHIEKLSHDQSYQVFVNELRKAIKRVK